MVVKLYSFLLSPPARLAKLVAEICEVNAEYIEVDLSRADQISAEFLAVNPKHQVPALDDNGVLMAQSRDICRHFLDNHNQNPDNDHWYPKDPLKREEVNKWLEWSKPLHLALEKGIVMSYMGPQAGLDFRENYGLLICLLGAISRMDGQVHINLKKEVDTAEEMLREREIKNVEDLNLGDLATFMEVSLVMECHPEYNWNQYPNLLHLYSVCKEVPHFDKVHQPFLEYCENYRHHRDVGTTASWPQLVVQAFTGVWTGLRMAKVNILG